MQVLSEPKSFLSGFFNMFQPSTEELNYYLLWTFGHTNCFQQTVWSVVRVGHMGTAVSWRWVTLLLDILWGGLSPEQKPLCCAEPHLCGVVVVYFPWREGQSSPPINWTTQVLFCRFLWTRFCLGVLLTLRGSGLCVSFQDVQPAVFLKLTAQSKNNSLSFFKLSLLNMMLLSNKLMVFFRWKPLPECHIWTCGFMVFVRL